MVLTGIFTASCKLPDTPSKFKVTFAQPQNGKLTAKSKDGAEIKSGAQVLSGTTVVFTAEPETGFLVEKWTEALSSTKPTERTVQLVITKDVTAGVVFKKHPESPPSQNPGSNSQTPGGGNQTPEGGSQTPGGGSPAPGGNNQTPGGEEQGCTVTFEQPEHGILNAWIENGTRISSNSKVKKGTNVIFTADPSPTLIGKFHIKNWSGALKDADPAKNRHSVTVHSDITVAVEFEENPVPDGKIRIIFDKNITCINTTASPEKPISSYDDVDENTNLKFSASANHIEIQDWRVNNDAKSQEQTFEYTVKKDDALDNRITVSYTEKVQPVIEFDAQKMTVEIREPPPNNLRINTGEKVAYGVTLIFKVTLSQDHTVKDWMINKEVKTAKFKKESGNHRYTYTVAAEDVKDGKLVVEFNEKPISNGSITFNEGRIEVYAEENPGVWKKIQLNAPISEGQTLAFLSILPSNKKVSEWQINDRKQTEYTNPSYVSRHVVSAGDFSGSVMKVSIRDTDAVHGTIEFDADVTCQKINPITQAETPLNTNDSIKETDYLSVSSSKGGTGIWKINGNKPSGFLQKNPTEFSVEQEHFSNGKLKIEFIQ